MYSMCLIAQSCPTLCSPVDYSLGSFAHGIFQARKSNRFAISFSRGSSWPRDWTHVFCSSNLGRRVFYHCTTWEALSNNLKSEYLCLLGAHLTDMMAFVKSWASVLCVVGARSSGWIVSLGGRQSLSSWSQESIVSHRPVMTFGCLPCAWPSMMSSCDDR